MCMHNYYNKDKLNGKKAEHVTKTPSIYYGNMLGLVSRPQAKTVCMECKHNNNIQSRGKACQKRIMP